MAAKASPERNRHVDFLRVFLILTAVVGHWLVGFGPAYTLAKRLDR